MWPTSLAVQTLADGSGCFIQVKGTWLLDSGLVVRCGSYSTNAVAIWPVTGNEKENETMFCDT